MLKNGTKWLVLLGTMASLTWNYPAFAETGKFNIHIESGPGLALTGWQAQDLGVGLYGTGRFEFVLTEWIGIDLGAGYLQFFKANHPQDLGYKQIDRAYLVNTNIGFRFRLLNDDKGYLLSWKREPDHSGNLFGNLWIDLHCDYYFSGGYHRFGGDAALGAELSLVNGLQVGPLVRAMYVHQPDSINRRDSEDAWIIIVGLSFSIAIPSGARRIQDVVPDRIVVSEDTRPTEPEDRNKYTRRGDHPDPNQVDDSTPERIDESQAQPLDDYPDKALVEFQFTADTVLLEESVYFATGMSRLDTQSRTILDRVSTLVKTHPGRVIVTIEGYTDTSGLADFNIELARKRANRVKDYLVQRNLNPDLLSEESIGESDSQATYDREEKLQNRRVDLRVIEIVERKKDHKTPQAIEGNPYE